MAIVRAYPDEVGFRDIGELDRFDRELVRAAAGGAVAVIRGTGRDRDRLVRVDLVDAGRLFEHLGRVPSATRSEDAAAVIFGGARLATGIEGAARQALAAWARNKAWCGLAPGDTAGLRTAVSLAQALLEDRHRGLDYRTFSLRHGGGTKALERLEPAVLRILSGAMELPAGNDGRAILSEMGLDRFGPPLLLSGPIRLDDFEVPAWLPYFGIPPREIARVVFVRRPRYILSIENQTSFNRQVMEVDPGRSGLTFYSGGYPSLDAQRAIAHISRKLSDVPFFHWSDIDPEGAWIFRTVERAAGRPIIPHMMDAALAQVQGVAGGSGKNLRPDQASGSAIAGLVGYFEQEGAKWLEQEALDPTMPEVGSCAVPSRGEG